MNYNRRVRIIFLVTFAALLPFALAPGSTSARSHPRARCQLVPDTWNPSLDQARSYVEAKAKAVTNTSQQQLTQTSQVLADLRDAELFITYVQLMQSLDAKGQAELLGDQSRWLAGRTAAARAAVTSPGGTLAPLEYSGAFATLTEQRLAALQKRLPRQRGTAP